MSPGGDKEEWGESWIEGDFLSHRDLGGDVGAKGGGVYVHVDQGPGDPDHMVN